MDTKLHTELKKDDPLLVEAGECIDRWTVERLISVGGFGQVFAGFDNSSGRRVAIKVESLSATVPLLKTEAYCLQHVSACQRKPGDTSIEPFLHFYAFGKTLTTRYLVMDLCGPNLRELKKATPFDRFSMTTSLWVMYKMISALRHLHHMGYIHRDVKPANFCIGYNSGTAKLFILDFGMCRYYLNRDGSHRPRKEHSAFHGTVRYASLNTHKRKDLCRFDDIWSIYYITCEHMIGALPWRMVTDKNQVMDMKEHIDLLQLTFGEELRPPMCVSSLLSTLHNWMKDDNSFYKQPDYDAMMNEINSDLLSRNFSVNSPLDWELPPVSKHFGFYPCMMQNPTPLYVNNTPRISERRKTAFGDYGTPDNQRQEYGSPNDENNNNYDNNYNNYNKRSSDNYAFNHQIPTKSFPNLADLNIEEYYELHGPRSEYMV